MVSKSMKDLVRVIYITILIFIGIIPINTYAGLPGHGKDSTYHDVNVEYPDSVIIQRLADLNSGVELSYNEHVKEAIDYFANKRRSFVKKVLRRKNLYFETYEKYLDKYGLPEEIKYLSVIESGLNPNIASRAGAVGLWQFMPGTGKIFQMKSDYYIDQRMDPEKSTEAACKYLKSLHEMFDDWHLALAAYNAGPGNVRKAIRKSGYKETFWEIYDYLPKETKFYVPKFIAINYMMNYHHEHNIHVDDELYPIKTDTLIVNQYFNINVFCKMTGVCFDDVSKVNPSVKRGVIPDNHKGFAVKIPYEIKPYVDAHRKMLFDSARKHGPEQLAYKASVPKYYTTENKEKYVYRVRSGDALSLIAGRFNCTVSQLKYWNGLTSSRINVGQKLNIYKDPKYFKKSSNTSTISKNTTTKPKPKPLPSGKAYRVKSGDSLWSISQKFGISVEKLKKLNGLKSNRLDVGQILKLG